MPAQQSAEEVAVIEPFWREVRASFALDPKLINLDNGAGAPSPQTVHDSLKRHLDEINRLPAHYGPLTARRVDDVRRELAIEFGCDPSELVITAGSIDAPSAALGMSFQAGDEVVASDQDHPAVINFWDQRARRDDIVVRRVQCPTPAAASDLLRRFEGAITARTRVLSFPHVSHATGQLFPVGDLSRLARSRNIVTAVDGSQALGHFPFRLRDLECDVYGASLETWLMASQGTGLLYVRGESLDRARATELPATYPAASRAAVAEAITFHRAVGPERKAARLRYLTMRWINGLRSRPQVRILSSLQPNETWGLAAFSIDQKDAATVVGALLERQGIVVGAHGGGIRVSPGVYTSIEEIDRFVSAVRGLL